MSPGPERLPSGGMLRSPSAGCLEGGSRPLRSREGTAGEDYAFVGDAEIAYDELGFAVAPSGDALAASARAYQQGFEIKAQRRLARFQARRQRLPEQGDWLRHTPKGALKQLLRKGVPPELRNEVWWSVLGCGDRMRNAPGTYHRYLGMPLEAKASEEIERDLLRTFPNHRRFQNAAGVSELRNVLRAFAVHSPSIRYCQGLNFITALLLIVFDNEEQAFWALVCAMDHLGVEGYYVEGMTLLRADMKVLQVILQERCPRAANQLLQHGVDLMAICSEWYLTWFAKCLPVSTLLRVWDALFFEGFKVFFRVALGVFRRVEAEILQCPSFDQLMERSKQWPRIQVQHNELLKASFGDSLMYPLRRAELVKARDEALSAIAQEDQERNRRRLEWRR